jgi:polar amino acid transport system substrate-binding protein
MRASLILVLSILPLSAYSKAYIDFMTGFLPPYAYTSSPKLHAEDDALRGDLVDRLRQACDRAKLECHFTMRHPWNLAVKASKKSTQGALFPVYRTSLNENAYQWVGPIKQRESLLVVTRSQSPVVLPNLSGVKLYKTGMRKNLKARLDVPSSVHLSMSDHLLWRELSQGQIDLWIAEESVVRYYEQQHKVELKTLLAIDEQDLWVALNKKVSQDVILKLNTELRKTLSSGLTVR